MFRPWESSYSSHDYRREQVLNEQPEEGNSVQQGEEIIKRRHLSQDAQDICLNVCRNLMKIYGMKKEEAIKNAATLTEVSTTKIRTLFTSGIKQRKKRKDYGKNKKLTPFLEHRIRKQIYFSYKGNEIPTVETVYRTLPQTQGKFSETSLKRWLKQMGFRYKKICKRTAIVDHERIINWKSRYLTSIAKFRQQNKAIYYLDETWFDTHDTAAKGWTDSSSQCIAKTPTSKGKRLIILHCGSEEGWVPNCLELCGYNLKDCNVDYHKNMKASIFEQWFQRKLLPNIKPNSVIVMDNAPYHSRQVQKIPCKSSSKVEIQDFLLKYNLFFEDNYTKDELLEILKIGKF
ncbi:PREDICTED: uncharacterized protein LOC108577227 [Habropoda laboriosa]|uniref:uncharacterized protein LOC108577227 n=1 Tax=Habropoda laboriosa TaxID=597456 RepID=UPI00083D1A20|nr:PREDICTED: uncharacterized protein LOC108577227 [Habropoda laboriosa]